jgi:hypothetical protein
MCRYLNMLRVILPLTCTSIASAQHGNGITTGCTKNSFGECGPGCVVKDPALGGPPDGKCYQCGQGFYKDGGYNSASCYDCQQHAGSNCVKCTANTQCICNAGYYGDHLNGGPCNECPPASGSACKGLSNAFCTVLESCTCNAGYTGPGGYDCEECAAGKYKIGAGSIICSNCPTGKFSAVRGATAEAVCQACPANSGGMCQHFGCCAATACTCNSGYTGPDGGPCTASCVVGQYTSNLGVTCTDCTAGFYADTIHPTACVSCPAGQYSNTARATACLTCAAGQISAAGSSTCLNCAAGTYSPTTGMSSCFKCAAGLTSAAGSSTETACQVQCSTDTSLVSGVCVCRRGLQP